MMKGWKAINLTTRDGLTRRSCSNFFTSLSNLTPTWFAQAILSLSWRHSSTDRWDGQMMTAFSPSFWLYLSHCPVLSCLEIMCSNSANSSVPPCIHRWRPILVLRRRALTNLDCGLACFLEVPSSGEFCKLRTFNRFSNESISSPWMPLLCCSFMMK